MFQHVFIIENKHLINTDTKILTVISDFMNSLTEERERFNDIKTVKVEAQILNRV